MNKPARSRAGTHLTVAATLLAFLFTALTAFPGAWNQTAAKAGLPAIPDEPYRLGLDLQGGAHLVYEADMSAIPDSDRAAALEGVRDVIERRVNAFGVSEPLVLTNVSGDSYQIVVELAGIQDVTEATKEIGETPILEFKVPNTEVTLEATPEITQQAKDAQVAEREAALAVLDRALDEEDFASLVSEFSIDESTTGNAGIVGFVTAEDPMYGELIDQIRTRRLKPGVIDGLYESDSTIHVMKYLSREDYDEIQLSHILICHNESSRCESERTKIEAQLMIEDLARQATTRNFDDLAIANSEDGSAESGGDLGWVKKGVMVAPFENAAFALKNNQISSVIETEFGYHLIFRRDSRSVPSYELAHIELPWTTVSDLLVVDPWMNTELSGKQLKSATVVFDQTSNAPLVSIAFDDEGAELFANLTKDHIGDVIGIFLDGEPISTPVVQQAIYGGEATITGQFTLEEAKLLAQRLTAGALPVPIELISQQTVGPTLGQISLEKSVQAAFVGFVLIALFMVINYRLPGVLAVIALAFYTGINLSLYKWLDVTITLSGIAGFILSLGIAVDAGVLIFERLKEELKSGRDLPTAIDEGFRRAWTSIRDGNLTTIIAATVLFNMSTSFVKGFALTLDLGILTSMLTAILVTRVWLKWISGWRPLRASWLYKGGKTS